jgi:hypothetical protein
VCLFEFIFFQVKVFKATLKSTKASKSSGTVFTTLHVLRKLTNRPNKLECLSLTRLSSLVHYNTSLLGLFVSYEENDML